MWSLDVLFVVSLNKQLNKQFICSLSMFVHKSNHNMQDASMRINCEICKVVNWSAVNKSAFTKNKTKFLVFHYHQYSLVEADIPKGEIFKELHNLTF